MLLDAIRGHANKTGVASIRVIDLADELELSQRTVLRYLKRLEGRRLIARLRQSKPNGHRATDLIILAPWSDRGGLAELPAEIVERLAAQRDSLAPSQRDSLAPSRGGDKVTKRGACQGDILSPPITSELPPATEDAPAPETSIIAVGQPSAESDQGRRSVEGDADAEGHRERSRSLGQPSSVERDASGREAADPWTDVSDEGPTRCPRC